MPLLLRLASVVKPVMAAAEGNSSNAAAAPKARTTRSFLLERQGGEALLLSADHELCGFTAHRPPRGDDESLSRAIRLAGQKHRPLAVGELKGRTRNRYRDERHKSQCQEELRPHRS